MLGPVPTEHHDREFLLTAGGISATSNIINRQKLSNGFWRQKLPPFRAIGRP